MIVNKELFAKTDKLFQRACEQSGNTLSVPEKPGYYVTEHGSIYQYTCDHETYQLSGDSSGDYWIWSRYIMGYWNGSDDMEIMDLSDSLVEELKLKDVKRYYRERPIEADRTIDDDSYGKLLNRLPEDDPLRGRLCRLKDEAIEEFKYFTATVERKDMGYQLLELDFDTELRQIYAARKLGSINIIEGGGYTSKRKFQFLYPMRVKCSACLLLYVQQKLENDEDDEIFIIDSGIEGFVSGKLQYDGMKEGFELLRDLYPEHELCMHVIRWDGSKEERNREDKYFIDVLTGDRWEWTSDWTDYREDETIFYYPTIIEKGKQES